MKAAIYSPYLDTLGGGEKYMMTIAEILSRKWMVDVLLDEHLLSFGQENLKISLSQRFNLDLKSIKFIRAPVGKNSSFWERLFFLKKYDLLFYLTDGSIFYPSAKKNILHIQSPLVGQPATSLWGKLKLQGWNLIIYNSKFTQDYSKSNWPITSEVIYPPVETDKIKPLKKKNYILSVGRFFGYLKNKKHQLLIDTFRELYDEGKLNSWSLHLVGSASEGDKAYILELKKFAKGLPVNFYPNLAYKKLVKLYGQSGIYWHAMGFDEEDPVKMEHFGISVVEAMAGECIPVVVDKGGLKEIVDFAGNGYLWNNLTELKTFTRKLIDDQSLRQKLGKHARKKSQDFSKDIFQKKIINVASE